MDARTMRSAAKLMEQMALARVNKAGVQIMPRMRWDCELAPGAGRRAPRIIGGTSFYAPQQQVS